MPVMKIFLGEIIIGVFTVTNLKKSQWASILELKKKNCYLQCKYWASRLKTKKLVSNKNIDKHASKLEPLCPLVLEFFMLFKVKN